MFIIFNKLLEKKVLSRSKQLFKGQTAPKAGEIENNEETLLILSRKRGWGRNKEGLNLQLFKAKDGRT